METTEHIKPVSRGAAFVRFVLARLEHDTGFGAALRRADNPATEVQSWEHLIAAGCDLGSTSERACYATVAAGLARAKRSTNEPRSIGSSIARCYQGGNKEDSAKQKLRRLLTCDTTDEVCQWVRPTLRLAEAKGVGVNFSRLLDDLLHFGLKVKERWATDFYGQNEEDHDSVNA